MKEGGGHISKGAKTAPRSPQELFGQSLLACELMGCWPVSFQTPVGLRRQHDWWRRQRELGLQPPNPDSSPPTSYHHLFTSLTSVSLVCSVGTRVAAFTSDVRTKWNNGCGSILSTLKSYQQIQSQDAWSQSLHHFDYLSLQCSSRSRTLPTGCSPVHPA